MKEEEQDIKDSKAIEEKALNYFKAFIEDSKVISQFIADNDKEPCWDGHLYLYSDGKRDKEHLLGRVPVQIKGTEVTRFVTKGWKYKLEKTDLKAYLHEPTFFIVCQVKKNSKERKLFYRELLPNRVNTLLKDMGKNDTRKTLFHPLTEDLKEFEDQLKVFMSNSKKMVSFADAKPLTMKDAVKQGIKDFSFVAPTKFSDKLQFLKYLSTHRTYLYAKVSKELDIDMPLADGPSKLTFKRDDEGEVKVGDRVFFRNYRTEIKDGRLIISVPEVLTLNMPMDETDKVQPIVKMKTSTKYLKQAINEAEFGIALNDVGVLTVGDSNYNLKVNEPEYVEELREVVKAWKEWDAVLDKLHVTKAFDLTGITKAQEPLMNLLIETIGKGKTVKLPGQDTTLLTLDISNVTLLLWCVADKDGNCSFGDFFDKTIRITYKMNDGKYANVSPYSYLQLEKKWEKIDNIDYGGLVDAAKEAVKEHEYCYNMANYDVLAMISAADVLEEKDAERSRKLLEEALKLNDWLIENDPKPEMKNVNLVNKIQIVKRQRGLSGDDVVELERMLTEEGMEDSLRVGVNLLLDRQNEAEAIFGTLPEEEKKRLREFPVWRYWRTAME